MGFGEDQLSFGWFSWEFLSFCFISSDSVLDWGVFDVFFWSPLGFVTFSFVIKLNGSGLWVLEKIS